MPTLEPATVHRIPARFDTVFRHAYPADKPELRRLYENAKRDQWNASRDVPWDSATDPTGRIVADELIDIHGTPYWDALGERERVELNRRLASWRLGVLLYGEHGAMLVCSQLVETLSGADAKLFQATQVMDEARHSEVLNRYLDERLGGLMYPMPPNERELFDVLLGDPRWPVKTIGLQLVAETFAVALFKMLGETSVDPLLREVCRRILQDESRHMGFGMLSLPDVVQELGDSERKELEDFTVWALVKTLTGLFPEDVYRDMGFTPAQIEDIKHLRRDRAAGGESSLFRRLFKRELHGALVQNLARIGLLTERLAPQLEAIGIRAPAATA
jgi:hypothetical protein